MTTVEKGSVLMLITIVAAPIAATVFARSGPLWRSIGKGPLSIDEDLPHVPRHLTAPEAAVDPVAQKAEVRQMLEAKSARRLRRGEAALDIEAETARLLQSPPDSSRAPDVTLRYEVRQLVVARNERRLRRGRRPLDVEAETDKQLADLIGSS
jgi:hypothetical protein